MRQLLIDRVTRQGWTQAATAAAAGISVRTVAKWIERARHGDGPLEDAGSRPHRGQLDLTRTTAILAYRQQRATAWEISARVGVPRSTVTRVLQRAGLNRVSRLGRHRSFSGMNGRGRATSCTWTSSHSVASGASAIGFMAICLGNSGASATSMRMWRLMTPPGWRMSKSAGCNGVGPAPRSYGTPSPGFAAAASPSVGCSPTMARATSLAGSPACAIPGSCGIASRDPIRHAPTAKRNALSKRSCANGPIDVRSSAPRAARPALVPYLRFYNHRRPHASLGRRSPWLRFQEAAA